MKLSFLLAPNSQQETQKLTQINLPVFRFVLGHLSPSFLPFLLNLLAMLLPIFRHTNFRRRVTLPKLKPSACTCQPWVSSTIPCANKKDDSVEKRHLPAVDFHPLSPSSPSSFSSVREASKRNTRYHSPPPSLSLRHH